MSSTRPDESRENDEHGRAEQSLLVSEARFRLLVDQLPFSVQILDPDGRTVRVNRSWERLWGITLEQLGGYNLLEDQQLVERGIMPYIRRAFSGEATEIPPVPYAPDRGELQGQERWTRAIIYPVLNDDGSVREVVLIHEDITARRAAEESVAYHARLLGALTESVPDGILIVSPDGRLLHRNQRFLEIWNFPPHVLEQNSDEAALAWAANQTTDPAEFLARVHRVYEHPEESVREELVLKDGRVFDRFGATVHSDDTRFGWVWTFRDITARKQAERNLERAKQEAEEANRAKDRFLATLSHELRTPLTPVLMSVAVLRADPSLNDAARAELEVIERNVQLETVLINDLLDITRIAHGKLELRAETVDLHRAIDQALRISANDLEHKHLRVVKEFVADEHHSSADAARLQQAFWNVIKNAVKFTPARGELRISTRNIDDRRIVIEFVDSGIGIDPEQQARIFTAFEQGNAAITSRYGGLGLGLTIAKRVVDMHGGEISVRSEGAGRGATFSITLDVMPGSAPSISAPSVQARARKSTPQVTILLVEDNADSAGTLRRLLEGDGHAVIVAQSLASAREIARTRKFDLLISDIGLPDGTGLELMREVRARSATPAIALSGFGMRADLASSAAAGFAEHLTKPVDWERLRESVARLLAIASTG